MKFRRKLSFQGVLLAYSVTVTTVIGFALARDATGNPTKVAYDEIDVKRINLREDDGTLRMVISNKARFPGLIIRGKERPHPNRKTAGFLFFNEEGTENGGLIFGGKTENGKITSGGHLSFDQYEQDQTIQMTFDESDGQRRAAFIVHDYPDGSNDFDAWDKAAALPDAAAKEAEFKRLKERYGPRRRAFMGRSRDRSSALALFDGDGRPRIMLKVTTEGAASMEFLDENGKVVKTVTPSSQDAG
jgi:hypothetical protein